VLRKRMFGSSFVPVAGNTTTGSVAPATGSITVSKPVGVAVGDIIAICFQGDLLTSGPAGWTLDPRTWTSPTNYHSAVAYKTMVTADLSSSWTFNIDTTAGWGGAASATFTHPAISANATGGVVLPVINRVHTATMTPPTDFTSPLSGTVLGSWKMKWAIGHYTGGSLVWTSMNDGAASGAGAAVGWTLEVI
jgi:hypothetical protein